MLATHYHKDIEVRRLGLDQWPRQELSYLPDAEYGRRPYYFGARKSYLLALVRSPVLAGCLAAFWFVFLGAILPSGFLFACCPSSSQVKPLVTHPP